LINDPASSHLRNTHLSFRRAASTDDPVLGCATQFPRFICNVDFGKWHTSVASALECD
jgi:hypothetical protein